MFRENFVVAVKCGGKILRERDGAVRLPFGSEFSLLLKNLEGRKASVKVSIDGQEVLGERSLILNANSSLELERFVESLDHGNRFKFIQKTKEIADHRGDRVDDGIIRVEFAFEQMRCTLTTTEHHHYDHHHHHDHHDHYHDHWPTYWPYYGYPYLIWTAGGSQCQGGSSLGVMTYCSSSSGEIHANSLNSSPLPDEGITVKGSESNQHFNHGSIGTLDAPQVITLRLVGVDGKGEQIEKPITVHTNPMCSTCGRKNAIVDKFCSNCGTWLG